MPLQWFEDIPAEIRNKVYHEIFKSMRVSSRPRMHTGGNSIHPGSMALERAPLNLFLSSKRFKQEAESYFWVLSSFIYTTSSSYSIQNWSYRNQFEKIQSLRLRGSAFDLRETLDFALALTQEGEYRRMISLEIDEVLDLDTDYGIISQVILRSKDRVGSLRLKVNIRSWAYFHMASARQLGPKQNVCKLVIRNTYDISITSEKQYGIPLVTWWLKDIYGQGFGKLKFMERLQCASD